MKTPKTEIQLITELMSLRQQVTDLEQQLANQVSNEIWTKIERAKHDWEATVDVLPELVCLLNKQQRIIRANRTVERWGLSSVIDVRGQEFHYLFHQNCTHAACYLKSFLQDAWPTLMCGQETEYEITDKILNRDLLFQIRPMQTSEVPSPLEDELNQLSFAVLVIYDVTQRRQAEQALQWEQLRNEIIIDRAQDGFIIMDMDGRLGEINQAYCKMVGYEHEELVGRHISELDVHEAPVTIAARLKRITRTNAEHFETKQSTKDGQIIHLGVNLNYVEFGGDQFIYTFVRNITERKQLEEQLREYSDHLEQRVTDRTRRLEFIAMLSGRLNTILDLPQLLAELVNQLKETFEFYHAHVYFIEENGHLVMAEGSGEVGQKLKQRGHRLTPEQGIVGTVARTDRYFLSNNVAETAVFFRNPLLPKTKSELAVPLRKGQQIIGVLDVQSEQLNFFTVEDVSLMESIADQTAIAIDNARLLADRQATIIKLQELDRMKSEFLTSMSHELRTPLNVILGFADLLLEGIEGDLTNDVRNDVQLIYNSGQHLLVMVNDILDISKIEAGMMELVPEFLDISEVVEEVLSVGHTLASSKRVDIVTELPTTLPQIYADKTRLKQILMNLLNNAIKFTSKGRVTIKIEIIGRGDMNEAELLEGSKSALPEEWGTANQFMRFAVIDTGVGVPLEKQNTIFERFKQADMSKTREYGGTGLGLAICKSLVEMHGGRMGVKSKVGVGSEFYFTIPIVKGL